MGSPDDESRALGEDVGGLRFDYHLGGSPRLLWKSRTAKFYGETTAREVDGHIHVGGLLVDADTGRELGPEAARDEREEYWIEGAWGRSVVKARGEDDGAAKWCHHLRPSSFHHARLTISDEAVYVSGSGKAGFSSDTYIHAAEGYVLALDKGTGDVLWMYTTGGEVQHAPVVADGRVYAGDVGDVHRTSRHIYCLSAVPRSRLGECLWKYRISGLAEQGMVAGGTVYWGDYQGYVYAIDAGSGRLRWRFQAGAPVASAGPPCLLHDWIFVGSQDGYLYGLDARTGALRWKYYVVDDDALRAEAEEEAQRESTHDHEMDEWNEEERRESEAYDASLAAALKRDDEEESETSTRAVLPSSLDVYPWASGGRLYMLTTQGFLHCFELPEPAFSGR